jgi:DNA sulfur modification protein DndB
MNDSALASRSITEGEEMPIPNEVDLSAGQYVKGMFLTETIFMAKTNFAQLKLVTRNPTYLQQGARQRTDDEVDSEAKIHALIQRALTGKKSANVPGYRTYIEKILCGEIGVLPPMHLWSEQRLEIIELGDTYALVPNGERLLAIDGETQLTAHWALAGSTEQDIRKLHLSYPLMVIIHHGVPAKTARQYFHDLNTLSIRPNASLSLSMDTKDPIMQVVDDLEASIEFLMGRVDRQSRQLLKRSTNVVTLQSLRQMVVNIARGISGIQYGARPAPIDDISIDDLTEVAVSWIGAYMHAFSDEVTDRENYLAGSGAVLAAVGAIGQVLLQTELGDREARQEELIANLREIDWSKGDHWLGIAGNRTPTGVFSVKGTKEVSYAVFNALTDVKNGGYRRIRQTSDTSSPTDTSDLFNQHAYDRG